MASLLLENSLQNDQIIELNTKIQTIQKALDIMTMQLNSVNKQNDLLKIENKELEKQSSKLKEKLDHYAYASHNTVRKSIVTEVSPSTRKSVLLSPDSKKTTSNQRASIKTK